MEIGSQSPLVHIPIILYKSPWTLESPNKSWFFRWLESQNSWFRMMHIQATVGRPVRVRLDSSLYVLVAAQHGSVSYFKLFKAVSNPVFASWSTWALLRLSLPSSLCVSSALWAFQWLLVFSWLLNPFFPPNNSTSTQRRKKKMRAKFTVQGCPPRALNRSILK